VEVVLQHVRRDQTVISEQSESRRLRADARLVEQVVLQRLLADNVPQIIEVFELEIPTEFLVVKTK
jgi:hypothetical protein